MFTFSYFKWVSKKEGETTSEPFAYTYYGGHIGSNTFVHSTAQVSRGVTIGSNCVILKDSIVQEATEIADNTFYWSGEVRSSGEEPLFVLLEMRKKKGSYPVWADVHDCHIYTTEEALEKWWWAKNSIHVVIEDLKTAIAAVQLNESAQ